jgi:hypothetical protein
MVINPCNNQKSLFFWAQIGFIFLFSFSLFTVSCTMKNNNKERGISEVKDNRTFETSVINVFDKQEKDDFQLVIFTSSARYYKLYLNNKTFNESLNALKSAQAASKPVQVTVTEENGDIIEKVVQVK